MVEPQDVAALPVWALIGAAVCAGLLLFVLIAVLTVGRSDDD